MAATSESPKPNRMPLIVAGVLGCLVICCLLVIAAVGVYLFLIPIQATSVVLVPPTTSPVIALPTKPLPQLTQPPAPPTLSQAPPTLPETSPTLPQVSPTLPPVTVVATRSTPPPTAPRGRIAFSVRRGDRPEDNYIYIANTDGTGVKQILDRASEPTFSPDGKQIAYYHWTDGIFVANADGTDAHKILGETNSGYMAWSHDGRWIAFSVRPGGRGNIATDAILPDGSGRRHIVIGWSPSWSPDDTQLVFQTCRGTTCGIYKASSAGGGDAVLVSGDDGGLAQWSPDGRRIVYQREVDAQKQLFVMNADGSGKKQLTSGSAMHVCAAWALDGNSIFYRSPEGGTWAIWRVNADGSNPVKLINDMPPGDWPYDRIAVTK